MLVLSRQRDETITVGDDIEITVVDIRGDKVRLGINAPRSVQVHRKEVYEEIKREGYRTQKLVEPESVEPESVEPESIQLKEYLGDSVYIECHGDGVVLTTENGDGPSNIIVLEPEVLRALDMFRMRQLR